MEKKRTQKLTPEEYAAKKEETRKFITGTIDEQCEYKIDKVYSFLTITDRSAAVIFAPKDTRDNRLRIGAVIIDGMLVFFDKTRIWTAGEFFEKYIKGLAGLEEE